MEIREATPDDAEAVFEVHRTSIEELGRAAYNEAQVRAWGEGGSPDDYPIEGDANRFLVAEIESEVRGFGEISFEPGEYLDASVDAEVKAVYVHPDAARRGVGSALLAEIEGMARERGATTVGLRASLNAVPFYEDHGYERVAERAHEFSGGVAGRVVEMKTDL